MQSELDKLIEIMDKKGMATYFTTFGKGASKYGKRQLFTKTPEPLATVWTWKYREAKELLHEISKHLTPEQAERRTIHFINPSLKDIPVLGSAGITPTLYGGLQLIRPGERAPYHRHTAVNFRLILEAPKQGAYTTINGYRIELHRGDMTFQVPWVWHEHGNEGDSDLIWFAGLDAPLVAFLGGMFYEAPESKEDEEHIRKSMRGTGEDANKMFGKSVKPVLLNYPSYVKEFNTTYNPLVYYPFDNVINALMVLSSKGEMDPYVGYAVEYVNPLNGGPLFSTISTSMILLPSNKALKPIRRVENAVFIVFEGNVTFSIEGTEQIKAEPHDVVVIPSWKKYSIENDTGSKALIFKYSDSPLFKYMGVYRESFE
ncbi:MULTISPECIES: cupin domain-containing protein [Metallosphaera]|uniref:Cupin domain-containing protein n=1 Tax=Metallosphaera prunae TaxID=47304 RepID=A0A4D8RTM3_METPR|nr:MULTISPECIES: cupin domain-containing protein [Metallosphaera]QCO29124.1 cupin domain-containing protein [Metallosphaera prunae]BBL47293.1 gentisate 1,2-dioxygenase [Metallosphaera sedula]